jgi:Glycosyltransferase family 9 (heptosyltransferase)
MAADGTATTPMGYLREELQPGETLPGLVARGLPEALARCDEVVLSFAGKLGDTLLAFGAVAAVLKYLELVRPECLPVVRVRGPHTTLFYQLDVFDRFDVRTVEPLPASARTVLIGDRPGTSASERAGAGRVLRVYTCDPEEPPCWSSGANAYPALPARYFLTIERRVGIRLDDDGFMPLLHAADPGEAADRAMLNVGVVTATSWPMRKDYGVPRFLEALRQLAEDRGQQIRALIVPGREDATAPELDTVPGHVTIELLRDAHYSLAAQALAACDLVIGNDTGLTHLAAATRRPDGAGPQVIGLHARHSHTKWRTGLPWHHAIATAFSEKMHREDRCPVRDRIDDRAFGAAANIGAITPAQLAHAAGDVLTSLAKVDR